MFKSSYLNVEMFLINIRISIIFCLGRSRGSPYYFSDTAKHCAVRKRRDAPDWSEIRIIHRWIYYRGWYFEFIGGTPRYRTSPYYSKHSCRNSPDMEDRPAGYGVVDVGCVKACTDRYVAVFGAYQLLTNTCHSLANKLSEVICDYSSCPAWCSYKK